MAVTAAEHRSCSSSNSTGSSKVLVVALLRGYVIFEIYVPLHMYRIQKECLHGSAVIAAAAAAAVVVAAVGAGAVAAAVAVVAAVACCFCCCCCYR